MIDLTDATHHPALEEVTEILCTRTQNLDKNFFHVMAAFYFWKMASSMRAVVITKDRGEILVNGYSLGLATSGYGKGCARNVCSELLDGFSKRYIRDTFPVIAEQNLYRLANDKAILNGTDPQEEFEKLQTIFKRAGPVPFTFARGTPEGVAQVRYKLLLANCGAINLEIDEIGSNLIGSTELLNAFLELYDQGLIGDKLTKSTNDNQRNEEITGKTPTNLMLFGTPAKLFDGGPTEDLFYSFLETGYARRCLFGHGTADLSVSHSMTAAEVFTHMTSKSTDDLIKKWSTKFHELADPGMFGWKMSVDDAVSIELLDYKMHCEKAAHAMPDIDANQVKKTELAHRYFKALKLAGAYAFIDQSTEVEMEHLKQAILLTEESGKSLQAILHREKSHVKLGKYLALYGEPLTHHDLMQALPFYKANTGVRKEMITLATAWGYKNNVIIKKTFIGEIEFFKAESLEETDLSKIMISYSDHWAYNYQAEEVPFEDLYQLTQAEGPMHWCNHHFKGGHRAEENVFAGFNLIVVDVDGGVSLDVAHELLKEYKFLTYTTKRHSPEENRFRLILPINYHLNLDSAEYKEFMNGILAWLPFKTDESANQRSKKWETFAGGSYHYNMNGALFDALPFIPKTSKNEEFRKGFKEVSSLDNLERWFAGRMVDGNRNNNMIKFALALVDSGMDLVAVKDAVYNFDKKLPEPLGDEELSRTVMKTIAKRYQKAA